MDFSEELNEFAQISRNNREKSGKLLLKILKNILNNPDDPKYRNLNLVKISFKLRKICIELLIKAGFEKRLILNEDNAERLLLNKDKPLKQIQLLYDKISMVISTDELRDKLEAITIDFLPSDTDYKFATDEYKNGYPVTTAPKLDPIARILLMGVYNDKNIFSTFRGMRYIIKAIWEYTLEFNKYAWKPFIKTNSICLKQVAWFCAFPEPKDININMMPFIMSKEFEKTKLPKYLKAYYDPKYSLIKRCLWYDESQLDKICFLTIQESFVDKNKTQRRPGLHVEHPGYIRVDDNEWMKGGGRNAPKWMPGPWGGGHHAAMPIDGMYMASSVDKSCIAWDCKIVKGITGGEVIGHLGDIQHLGAHLSERKKEILERNGMYWLTDRTPHESMPMKESGYRQFFRLVTHNVSVWHEANSTPNPNGVVPDPNITRVIKRSKFDT